MPYGIKLLNNISQAALEVLPADAYVVGADTPAPDAIIVRSADMHEYARNRELVAIARAGAGFNNIPFQACAEDGVVVFNTPGANANAVKELVICALLLSGRDVYGGISWANTLKGEGKEVEEAVEKGKKNFVGCEISGKTLGIVGLGAIGVKVANAAAALGMKIVGYDPMLSPAAKAALNEETLILDDLSKLWGICDFITLHLPLNEKTRGVVGKAELAAMKKDAVLLNLARGGLVEEDALLKALEEGRLRSYVTDFPNGKIVGHEHVLTIPHLGASTPESEENCALMAAQQIKDYLEEGIIRNSVNYPAFDAPRTAAVRVCLLHRSAAPELAERAGELLKNCDVKEVFRCERGDVAYSVIDVANAPDSKTMEALAALEGALRVRCL